MDNNEMNVEKSDEFENMGKESEIVELTEDYETDEWGDTSNCLDIYYNPQVANELKPMVGQEFQTLEDV